LHTKVNLNFSAKPTDVLHILIQNAGMYKSRGPGRHGENNFYGDS